jgi:hypothetical protein
MDLIPPEPIKKNEEKTLPILETNRIKSRSVSTRPLAQQRTSYAPPFFFSPFSKKKLLLSPNSPGGRAQRTERSPSAVVSITYEEIGLFPRSFSRVFDRFIKQVFSDVEIVRHDYGGCSF